MTIQTSNLLSGYTPHILSYASGQTSSSQSAPVRETGTYMDKVTINTVKTDPAVYTAAITTNADDYLPLEDAAALFSAFYHADSEDAKNLMAIVKSLTGETRSAYLSVAAASGDQLDALNRIVEDFTSDEAWPAGDLNTFLDTALRAGDAASDFIKIMDTLSGEARKDFIDFSSGLEDLALEKFIQAADAQGDDIAGLIKTASQLSPEDQILFFDAAAGAGRTLDSLLNRVDELVSSEADADRLLLTDLLTAAGNAQGRMEELVDLSGNSDAEMALAFSADLDRHDLGHFLTAAAGGQARNLINAATALTQPQKSDFLTAASHAGEEITDLISQVDHISGQNGSSDKLSGYLNAAAKSGSLIGEHLALFSGNDPATENEILSMAETLTATDYKNFVSAAMNAHGNLDDLMAATQQLSGTEQSYFLYAAGSGKVDLEFLITELNRLSGSIKGDFIMDTVSSVSGASDISSIYMKETLSSSEFDNFLAAAAHLDSDPEAFIRQVESLDGSERKAFLAAAAASKEGVEDFLGYASRLEDEELSELLDFSGTLGRDDLAHFTTAVVNASAKGHDFIELARQLTGSEQSNFLTAAAADKKQVDNLTALVESLGGENRRSFLRAASTAGNLVGDLIGMAVHLLDSEKEGFFSAAGREGYDMNTLFFTTYEKTYELTGGAFRYMDFMREVADEINFDFQQLVQKTGDTSYEFVPGNEAEINRFITALEDRGLNVQSSGVASPIYNTTYHLAGTDPALDFSQIFVSAASTGSLLDSFIDSFM